jgi:hypothetical protein
MDGGAADAVWLPESGDRFVDDDLHIEWGRQHIELRHDREDQRTRN